MTFINRILLILLFITIHNYVIAQRTITGKVIDSATKKPIKEAFVTIQGNSNATATNFLGFFQLQVDSAKYLEVISPGYIPGRIEIPQTNNFQIALIQEKHPQYQGGWVEFYKFLQQNIRYPDMARRNGNQGRVYISFQIDTLGNMHHIEIIKDIGSGCGEMLIKVIEALPNTWVPTLTNAKFILPVTFYFARDPLKVASAGSDIDSSEGNLLKEITVIVPGIE